MDNKIEALERTQSEEVVELGLEHTVGCVQTQVLFTSLCCFPAEDANTGEEGPYGVGSLRLIPTRLQSLLMDCPSVLQGAGVEL